MNVYVPSNIRNVVLLGHSGSGKTTLAETMLFESGVISRRGSVKEGNTISDYHDIEKEKQKSVYSSLITLDWRGFKINLIDTPGTMDYFGEVIGPLKVAATGIYVLDAQNGVEVGTEALWKYTELYKTPSILVVNKVDEEKSDFWSVVEQAKERFGRQVVVVQYPYNEGSQFNAIIDVLKMTMYEFPESGGKPDKLPIPDSQKDRAQLLHNELIEAIAENDEMLMDLYFEKGELDEDEMREGLRKSMVNHDIFPLFCMSAEKNMGSGRLMGFIDNVAPSPLDMGSVPLVNGDSYTINPKDKPALFIFKTHSEPHVGDLSYFKVYAGSIQAGMDLVNATTGNSVRLGTLFTCQGNKRTEISSLTAGDIGAVVKLKDCGVNDTLHDKAGAVEFAKIEFPEPIIRTAIRSAKEGEDDKLASALHQLVREDPSLHVDHNQELRQMILSGQGEEHLAQVIYTLQNRYKIATELDEPKIPYRETITKTVRSTYKHKKQSGGAGQFADVHFLIEPWYEGITDPKDLHVRDRQEIDLSWGGKLVFLNCIVGGVIDTRFMPAILKGIMEKMENGPLTGSRARDVRVSVYDGSMHSVDSNDAAFKTASLMAFRKGFIDAAPQLMEPVYDITVRIPSEYMGDIMGDLATRRAQIQGMDSEGNMQVVKAKVPLAELYKYSTSLKSMTQGRASHSRVFSHYAPVPSHIQEKIVKENMEEEIIA
jgi:elongation factor G